MAATDQMATADGGVTGWISAELQHDVVPPVHREEPLDHHLEELQAALDELARRKRMARIVR